MKLRHAATLALVGWYLMVPPIPQTWSGDPDLPSVAIIDTCNPDAPLSEWRGKGEFEQLSECRAAQEKEPNATKEILEKFDEQSRSMGHAPSVTQRDVEEEEIKCASHAVCIATDDPRLKGHHDDPPIPRTPSPD